MRRASYLSFILMLALPSTAVAQIAPGQSGISTEHTYEGRGALDDLASFGQCFASNQTRDAIRLVSTPPGSVDEAKVYKALFSKEQGCLSDLNWLSVPWQYVRGAVGEGFYARAVPVPPELALPRNLSPEKVQSVMDAAACYAGKHPDDARALVEQTKPSTKEEAAALDAHWADFEACLPANMPVGYKFDSLIVRYRIAEALWREGWVHSK